MHCKSYSHFFSKKFQHICILLDVNFNESLANDIVSLEQLDPDETVHENTLIRAFAFSIQDSSQANSKIFRLDWWFCCSHTQKRLFSFRDAVATNSVGVFVPSGHTLKQPINVDTTSWRYNVWTLKRINVDATSDDRRWYDVVLTLCAYSAVCLWRNVRFSLSTYVVCLLFLDKRTRYNYHLLQNILVHQSVELQAHFGSSVRENQLNVTNDHQTAHSVSQDMVNAIRSCHSTRSWYCVDDF